MHPAQLMTQGSPLPDNTVLLGYIDKHPGGRSGLGLAVISFVATGVDAAWDGQCVRSLPRNWRDRVRFTALSK